MSGRRIADVVVGVCVIGALLLAVPQAAAQDPAQDPLPPPPPPEFTQPIKVWAGSLGAGLAMTKGGTDTSTLNVSYELARDARQRLFFTSTGLFLRGETDDLVTVDRTSADFRMDYRLTPKLSAFGRLNYLRDSLQLIDYLVSPTIGLGYAFIDTEPTQLSIDVSVGAVSERNTPVQVRTSAALAVGQRFAQQITDTARVTQQVSALWKIDDFGDGLYTFGAGVAASITSRSELKAEVLDTVKTELTAPAVDKNTVSLLVSVAYKF